MDHPDKIVDAFQNKPTRSVVARLLSIEVMFMVVAVLILGHFLLSLHAGDRRRHTCVICRLERVDYTWNYCPPTSRYNETSCSRWYPAHVEANHLHDWSPSGSIALINFYGQPIGFGDNFDSRGRAIWRIPPEAQIGIYEHFDDPIEAKRVFVSLTDKSLFPNRDDYLIMESLVAWVESGYAGIWQAPAIQKTRPTE